MKLLRDLHSCPPAYKHAVLALGNFDGVHLGHRAIVERCLEIAREAGAPAAVMTFEPHPREFFAACHPDPGEGRGESKDLTPAHEGRPLAEFTPAKAGARDDSKKLRLYPFRRKAEILRDMGIDIIFVARFNRRLASLSPQEFVELLHRDLAARHVVTGYNFAFGKNREGNTEFLAKAAKESGFGFSACPPVFDGAGNSISSSAIRQALASGDVQKAAALLGRPYAIEGHVRRGDGRGRTLGFPTANLTLRRLFKPRFGIYAVRVFLEGEWHDGVANLGIRPMFAAAEALLEAHMFDINRDMYGKYIRVELTRFLRDERHFDSTRALTSQMAADCSAAKEALHAQH